MTDAALLRQIAADLAALAATVGALATGGLIGPDSAFVNAVYAAFAAREFSASELLARGQWTDPPGRLLAALTSKMSVRAVGCRLAKLRGQPTATGLVLVQTSENRDGAVWRVCDLRDSQSAAHDARNPADFMS